MTVTIKYTQESGFLDNNDLTALMHLVTSRSRNRGQIVAEIPRVEIEPDHPFVVTIIADTPSQLGEVLNRVQNAILPSNGLRPSRTTVRLTDQERELESELSVLLGPGTQIQMPDRATGSAKGG